MSDWYWFILVTMYGSCVGSFLNVVICRVPEGKSVVYPPSRCPRCERRLAWYDNVPVLGWLWLWGRCRFCKDRISVQYPLVEAACAAMFGGLYLIYYHTGLHRPMDEIGFTASWPVFVVHLVLVSAMFAATVIDWRYYIIPLPIPWVATAVAVVGLPAATYWRPGLIEVCPVAGRGWWGAALGGAAGLLAANLLLALRVIPRSFDEEEELAKGQEDGEPSVTETEVHGNGHGNGNGHQAAAEKASGFPGGGPEEWLAHPHPRREVMKECLFLLPVVVGIVAGRYLLPGKAVVEVMGVGGAWAVLTGVVLGYLAGGGLIWGTRVLGTLAFGKEAMGLGDVHLLAAIGAVIGPVETVAVFFIAPFLGLLAAAVSYGVGKLAKGQVRVIPYGPYLAGAAAIWMALREPMRGVFAILVAR